MKIILNTVTNFGGKSLKTGDIVDVDLRIAQRWITKGIAYPVKEEVKLPEIPFSDYVPSKEEEKIIEENIKKVKEPEEVIFRESEIKSKVIKKAKKGKKNK